MSAAIPHVLELRSGGRLWYVTGGGPPHTPRWRWASSRRNATVFPTRAAADRFRIDHCNRYLSGYERRAITLRPASETTP